MTDKEIQYNLNAQKCRAMGHYLEILVEEMKYHDLMLDIHNKEITLIKISDTRQEVNEIFDRQVDLYFEINDESTKKSRAILMEAVRPRKS